MKALTVEEAKDEVAKKNNYSSWEELQGDYTHLSNDIVEQVAILYHQRKLEEAGRELPSIEDVDSNSIPLEIYDWMHTKASTLLASKQAEIEQWKTANHNQSDKILLLETKVQKQSYEIIALKAKPANTSQEKPPKGSFLKTDEDKKRADRLFKIFTDKSGQNMKNYLHYLNEKESQLYMKMFKLFSPKEMKKIIDTSEEYTSQKEREEETDAVKSVCPVCKCVAGTTCAHSWHYENKGNWR